MTGRTFFPVILFVMFVFLDSSWARAESDLVRVKVDDSSHVIGEIQRETDTQIELLDLKTAKMLRFKKAEIDSVEDATEKYAISVVGLPHFVAWKIEKHLPPRAAVGKIAATDGTSVFVTLGSNHQASEGQQLGVFRGTKEIRDPDTGEVLGKQQQRIAALKVIRVDEKFCKAELAGDTDVELHVGDVVKGNEGSDAVAVLPVVGGDGDESVDARRMVEKITTGLVNRDIPIVERRLLDAVSDELVEQQDRDVFDPSTAQRVGKRVGAFAVLVGTITPENRYSRVQMRLVEVETAKLLTAFSHILRGADSGAAWETRNEATRGRRATSAYAPPSITSFSAAEAGKLQEGWAEYLDIAIKITNCINMKFILIPPGKFRMGSPDNDPAKRGDERPRHWVRLTKPFYLGVHEVTQQHYEEVMDENPSFFKGPALPVEQLSWKDAVAFCEKLSETDDAYDYRLPTEAEWEYACRAGSTTRFCFGDDAAELVEYAWFVNNSGGRTKAVGHRRPNAWGLHDMHGNVYEWCADWYGHGYYSNSPLKNPAGSSSSKQGRRVLRGGCWARDAKYCRSAYRGRRIASLCNEHLGFRVVLVPPAD